MYLAWFSAGITSTVACKLTLDKFGKENVRLIYFKIDSAHPDNARFIADCEAWFGKKIEIVQSHMKDQFSVILQTRYVNGPAGAACTKILKKQLRFEIQEECQDYTGQVFGFEYSKKEINRAIRFLEQYPDTRPYFPLIEAKLTKDQCANILERAGIALPEMYLLGYRNNNCIGCVKGGMGYWNKIRKDFPEYFELMSEVERYVGRSCINGTFLDELDKERGRDETPVLPDCGTVCDIEFEEIMSKYTEEVFSGRLSIEDLVQKRSSFYPVKKKAKLL